MTRETALRIIAAHKDNIRYEMLPEGLRGGVQRYVEMGVPTGHFLAAVLSNNLSEAVSRADLENQRHLVEIVTFCHNYLPAPCYGSEEKYEAWIGALKPPVPLDPSRTYRFDSPARTYVEGIDYPVGGKPPL